MTKLAPWSPRQRPTAWIDYRTARGVDDAGRTVRPIIGGRRKHPNVTDLLDTAREHGVERVFLTGERPKPGWLLVRTPGWTAGAHYLDADLPVGRFTHELTGAAVELRRTAEWFGGDLDATAARAAWQLLAHTYAQQFPGGRLFDSPAGTGMDAWIRALPPGDDAPEQLSTDDAALIRATSPQHRVELFKHDADTLDGFAYLDGRFMYAALTRELGTGPVSWLRGEDVETWWQTDTRAPYARARYLVRFTVPPGWETLGILMERRADTCTPRCCPRSVRSSDVLSAPWHTPHAPGYTGETWADAAEVHLARLHGWPVEFVEGIRFTKGRPLDTWTARFLRAREAAATADAPEPVRDAVAGALRSILLFTIGAFHSTGRDTTRVVSNPMSYAGDGVLEQRGEVWIARERVELSGRNLLLQHPEYSAQVWGRAHARVLESPTGKGTGYAGALAVYPFDRIIGVRGDAVYLTDDPHWHDDGKVGRLRIKGTIPGPVPAPTTYDELNRLRQRAESGK